MGADAGALVESRLPQFAQAKDGDGTLCRFVFDKFLDAFKLCQQDLGNLISDTASEFWEVVARVLDLARALLEPTGSCPLFASLFAAADGPGLCVQLLQTALACLESPDITSRLASRGSHRLSALLGQVLALSLANPATEREPVLVAVRASLLGDLQRQAPLSGPLLHRTVSVLLDAACGLSCRDEAVFQSLQHRVAHQSVSIPFLFTNTREFLQERAWTGSSVGGGESDSSVALGESSLAGSSCAEESQLGECLLGDESGYEADVDLHHATARAAGITHSIFTYVAAAASLQNTRLNTGITLFDIFYRM